MIKKIIAVSDIHIPSLKGMEELQYITTKFIDKCKAICEKEGRENVRIVVLGDLFHNKISITNESIIFANNFLSSLGNVCKTIVIAGNHDFLMNNMDRVDSISSLFEIGKLDNVIYLDRELGYKSGAYVDENVIWRLYSSFDGFSIPSVSVEKANYPYNICVGLIHADINGSTTALGFVTDNGIAMDAFEGCDFALAGHIHKYQEVKQGKLKLIFPSSLKQQNFGETVTYHGFVVYNIEDKNNLTYNFVEVENDDYGFYKFSINSVDDIENNKEKLLNYN